MAGAPGRSRRHHLQKPYLFTRRARHRRSLGAVEHAGEIAKIGRCHIRTHLPGGMAVGRALCFGALLRGDRAAHQRVTDEQALLAWLQALQAEGVQLDWNEALWTGALLGRGAHPKALTIRTLRVNDERPPTPSEPMQALTLPLPLSMAFSVDHFELTGKTTLQLDGIRGHYRYGALSDGGDAPALPDTPGLSTAHRLRLDALQLADGHYRAQLSLGGEAPMPLALDLQGDIRTTVPDGAGLSLAAEHWAVALIGYGLCGLGCANVSPVRRAGRMAVSLRRQPARSANATPFFGPYRTPA